MATHLKRNETHTALLVTIKRLCNKRFFTISNNTSERTVFLLRCVDGFMVLTIIIMLADSFDLMFFIVIKCECLFHRRFSSHKYINEPKHSFQITFS